MLVVHGFECSTHDNQSIMIDEKHQLSLRQAASIKNALSCMVVLVILLAGLSACAQSQTTNSQTPITIGVSLSFSGDFKDDGQAMKQGYQLWADTVNNQGGLLGRPVKLVILDDKSDPDQVAKNYATLIHTDHVNLVFGPFSSLLTKAAAPVVQNAGYAFIEGAGGAPSVFHNGWNNLFAVSLPVEKNLTTFADLYPVIASVNSSQDGRVCDFR